MSSPVETTSEPLASRPDAVPAKEHDFIPYVAPMFAYVALSSLEGYLPSTSWYPAAYAVKAAVVAAIMWHYRSTWKDLRPMPGVLDSVLAAALGVLVIGLWIGLDGHYPDLPFMGGPRQAFDPNTLGTGGKWAFIAVRLIGLVLLVPVFEELFWRSFLNRWLIDQEFWKVPVGKVTWISGVATAVLFAMAIRNGSRRS